MNKKEILFIVILALIGLLIRLLLQQQMQWSFDSDEAIVGLMAKHINEGKEIPVFYYGQHYMGSFEPILTSLFYKLFGINVLTLRAAPTIFYLLLFPLIYNFGFFLGGSAVARASVVLMALSPNSFAEWSIRARGGFIETVFFCLLVLFNERRLPNGLNRSFRGLITTFITGFILGFGWWTNNQIVFAIVPIGLLYLFSVFYIKTESFAERIKVLTINFLTGSFAFLIGSLPFWIYNFNNNFASMGMFKFSEELSKNIAGYFSSALPIILGVKRFWTADEVFAGETIISFVIYGFVLISLFYVIYKKYLRTNKVTEISSELVLIVYIIFASIIFIVSSFGSLYAAPRYLLPLYPAIFLLISVALFSEYSPFKKFSSLVFSLILLINLATFVKIDKSFAFSVPGEPFVFEHERVARNNNELIKWLEDHNYKYVKTNYWIGYRLALETEEKIKFIQFADPFLPRIKQYEIEGRKEKHKDVPFVLTKKQSTIVTAGLIVGGYHFKKQSLHDYDVLYDVEKMHEENLKLIDSSEFSIVSNKRQNEINKIVDGDIDTRWGTGEHQRRGQFVKVTFNAPKLIKEINLETAKWHSDYPRELHIECIKPDKTINVLLDESKTKSFAYVFNSDNLDLQFTQSLCSELVLKQEGYHPVVDWSIAEMRIYE